MILGFLDPHILACPVLLDEKGAEAYIDGLIQWAGITASHYVRPVICASTPEVLAEIDGFPSWDKLRHALRQLGSVYSAKDIITISEGILKKSVYAEDLLSIRDVLYEDCKLIPDIHKESDPKLQIEFSRMCVMLLCASELMEKPSEAFRILSNRTMANGDSVSIESEVVDADYVDTAQKQLAVPFRTQMQVKLLSALDELRNSVDVSFVWANVRNKEDLRFAIQCYAMREQGLDISDSHFGIKDEFVDQVLMHAQGEPLAGQVRRTLLDVIQGNRTRDAHAIRKSSGGGSDQLMRGKDGAMRMDVNYDVHVHYWTTSNGPEFSWLSLTHHDLHIPR